MRARLLWTLMLLAAVFAMHGLSCAAADSDMTGMSMPATTAVTAAMAAAPQAPAGSVLSAVVVAGHQTAAMDTATGGTTGQPEGPTSSAHALMVCLAVLAGGVGAVLAGLAAWLARRRLLTVYLHTAGWVQARLDRAVACVPAPELSRLCVLRV